MQVICFYSLLIIIGFITFLNVNGNPVPAEDRIFCFQNHTPRGQYGRCDTAQVNPNDADGGNKFDTLEQCCAIVGRSGGFTRNRSGSRCASCTSVRGIDENGVDGAWSDWSVWTDCSATCGDGVQLKQRACNNPAPQHGGQDCHGRSIKTKSCNIIVCPIDGAWSNWSVWTPCLASCGDGLQIKQRACINPAPKHGGQDCHGSSIKTKSCNIIDCPIDGQWGEWGEYGECSETCGDVSQRTRTRKCDNPTPKNGGLDCVATPIGGIMVGAVQAHVCVDLPSCPTASPTEHGSGDCDDEDAEFDYSGSGSGAGCAEEPTAINPCSHLEDYYSYELCIHNLDIPEVPGNEDAVKPTPTQKVPTKPPQEPIDRFDYSLSSSY